MTSLSEVLSTARAYWEAKGRSSRMMPLRADRCLEMLKGWDAKVISLDKLGPPVGTALLVSLARDGLSKGSQASYYAAFRRALALSGISTTNWPKGPSAPRKVREPISKDDVARAILWLDRSGYETSGHLARALLATGMRVEVEALSRDAITYGADHLKVLGKGGHERLIPVSDPESLKEMLTAANRVPYATHLARWHQAIRACGVESRLPTFHAIRHLFATLAYARSGRNLMAVRDLMGHADVATTAGYIGVNLEELRHAAGV